MTNINLDQAEVNQGYEDAMRNPYDPLRDSPHNIWSFGHDDYGILIIILIIAAVFLYRYFDCYCIRKNSTPIKMARCKLKNLVKTKTQRISFLSLLLSVFILAVQSVIYGLDDGRLKQFSACLTFSKHYFSCPLSKTFFYTNFLWLFFSLCGIFAEQKFRALYTKTQNWIQNDQNVREAPISKNFIEHDNNLSCAINSLKISSKIADEQLKDLENRINELKSKIEKPT